MEKLSEEIQLPEEIIQHIQFFLSGKEAARTSILSKSWYTAWLTRPNLDFSESEIRAFERFVEKGMQRYEELKRKIQSFKLVMDVSEIGNVSLAKELIVKAMKLGPIDVDIQCFKLGFTLPNEVFQSKYIVTLSLHNCKIDQTASKFWGMISMCPMIEELILSLLKLNKGKKSDLNSGGYDFRKLKVLSLTDVKVDKWLFNEVSKFPRLKDLVIQDCNWYRVTQICSNSLECITLVQTSTFVRVTCTLDVPSIRKFKFSGSFFPSLYFKTFPKDGEWESDISITLESSLFKFSWFFNLNYFLPTLSPSKVMFRLKMGNSCRVYEVPDGIKHITRRRPIVVEKFTYEPSSIHHDRAILDGLFRWCHPRFIEFYWLPWCKANNDIMELLEKTLVKEESGEKSSMGDFEEVNVEFFEGCTSLPCKTLSDALAYTGGSKELKICLHLKWGGSV